MWNGSANRSIDDSFYRRPAWKKCRASFIACRRGIDGGLCQKCHEVPGRIVHHRIPLTPDTVTDPDIAYGFVNLELVCLECHNEEHGYNKGNLPDNAVKYIFDRDGNPVVIA